MTRFLCQEERLTTIKRASLSLAQIRHNASRLRDALKETFGLKGATSPDCDLLNWDHVDVLKKEYFHINDWMVSAFDDLLGDLENLRRPKWIASQINVRENVEIYREERTKGNACWQDYLPAMVFTYREIQNWREDSWSRDYLRTLLRTRTMVFCGYSGIDPVIHDTFRTVYEEMARRRQRREPADLEAREDLAFFLGVSDATEFHGQEILRAASSAAGKTDIRLSEHPSYLRFRLTKKDEKPFPNLDELLQWLFHRVYRHRQNQTLESELHHVAQQLWRHPAPHRDVLRIRENFQHLLDAECETARGWDETDTSREQLRRMTAWTNWFHPGLLREMAIANRLAQTDHADLHSERELREWPWYCSTLDHPDWTAWGVVVELALRRMIAAWRGAPREWMSDCRWIAPQDHASPTLVFSQGEARPAPALLAIRLVDFGCRSQPPVIPGAFKHRRLWELRPTSLPWVEASPSVGDIPSASLLWRWAARPPEAGPECDEDMGRYLGVDHVRG